MKHTFEEIKEDIHKFDEITREEKIKYYQSLSNERKLLLLGHVATMVAVSGSRTTSKNIKERIQAEENFKDDLDILIHLCQLVN